MLVCVCAWVWVRGRPIRSRCRLNQPSILVMEKSTCVRDVFIKLKFERLAAQVRFFPFGLFLADTATEPFSHFESHGWTHREHRLQWRSTIWWSELHCLGVTFLQISWRLVFLPHVSLRPDVTLGLLSGQEQLGFSLFLTKLMHSYCRRKFFNENCCSSKRRTHWKWVHFFQRVRYLLRWPVFVPSSFALRFRISSTRSGWVLWYGSQSPLLFGKRSGWLVFLEWCSSFSLLLCNWSSRVSLQGYGTLDKFHSLSEHPAWLCVQPGAVILVFWRHWMHLNFMHPVTSENQFHCTRLYVSVCLFVCLSV